jgi:hypothetical protein
MTSPRSMPRSLEVAPYCTERGHCTDAASDRPSSAVLSDLLVTAMLGAGGNETRRAEMQRDHRRRSDRGRGLSRGFSARPPEPWRALLWPCLAALAIGVALASVVEGLR